MSAHVVVIDTTARSAKIKTVPDKYLTEILEEACTKLGRDPTRYGLKHNNKNVDLSRTVRLAGLSSGAKLELVASSKSPSVVSVALQLPSTGKEAPTRLTDKFPSNTTLWLILRKFESAGGSRRNFTGRGVPVVGGDASGAGRLYFETPVIQIVARELVSFTDLQKTLAQLGLNSGTALLRLSFRRTDTPLEEAMVEIEQYFKEVEGEDSVPKQDQKSSAEQNGQLADQINEKPLTTATTLTSSMEDAVQSSAEPSTLPNPPPTSQHEPQTVTGPAERPISVFAPPSSSTPKAAKQAFNEKDYEPTIDHAKLHQQRLKASGQNQRLRTDAELVAQAEEQAQRNALVKEVKIKVRFPDQSQVEAPFSNLDTAQHLYEHVQGLMRQPQEPFSLTFTTGKGPKSILQNPKSRLIGDLGMVGRVLVNFVWEPGASNSSRTSPTLKQEFRQQAQEIQVKEVEGVDVEEKAPSPSPKPSENKGKEKKGGVPKWLKLPGKK